MKSKIITVAVLFITLCCVSLAHGSIEIVDPIYVDFTQGVTNTININCLNETENFSMHLDVLTIDDGIKVELWDNRSETVVSSFTAVILAPVDPDPEFILDNPILGIAAGDLGSFTGPYTITNGYRVDFTRNQNIGIAPNGLIGSVDLTFVPEPITLFLFGAGSILVMRKTRS